MLFRSVNRFCELVGARSASSSAVSAAQSVGDRAGVASFDESRDAGGVACASSEEADVVEGAVFVYFKIDAAGTGAAGVI